ASSVDEAGGCHVIVTLVSSQVGGVDEGRAGPGAANSGTSTRTAAWPALFFVETPRTVYKRVSTSGPTGGAGTAPGGAAAFGLSTLTGLVLTGLVMSCGLSVSGVSFSTNVTVPPGRGRVSGVSGS